MVEGQCRPVGHLDPQAFSSGNPDMQNRGMLPRGWVTEVV